MPKKISSLLFCVSLFLSVSILCGAEKEFSPVLTAKEKALPDTGTAYVYVDHRTPRHIINDLRAKDVPVAFLFDQRQAAWLRDIIPLLKGTAPIIFVRDTPSDMDLKRLRETIDFFNYEATLVHVRRNGTGKLPSLPMKHILTLDINTGKQGSRFVLRGASRPPETATLLSALDERDLAEDLSVARGMIFPGYRFRFLNIDEEVYPGTAGADRTILFSNSEKNVQKFIEKQRLHATIPPATE
ncbi:MAG TPA: hypothetical protein PKH10_04075 [bacterium]|nr:hypothetical protein [bacterium]